MVNTNIIYIINYTPKFSKFKTIVEIVKLLEGFQLLDSSEFTLYIVDSIVRV